jgi:ATP-dependent helicase/nuclease subunit A
MTHDANSTPTGTSTTPADAAEESFIRLDGAQRKLRDAFVDTDSGLFILGSDPGAGKSTTGGNVAAEVIGTLHEAGVPAPEQHIAVVSFSRDDAASIAPGIADALMMQARDPQSALDIEPETAEELGKRVTQADDRIGTVDAVLQSLFKEISAAVGFGDDVVVGETAGLGDLRSQCLSELRKEPRMRARLERLESAYPGTIDYQPSARELVVKAHTACRERQLTVTEFKQRLLEIIEEQYSDGAPTNFADLTDTLTHIIGNETAEAYAKKTSIADKATIVAADQQLYSDWTTAIEDLAILLEEYQSVYDTLAKQQGVVSHLDATHWIAKFFTEPAYESDFREGVQQRYHGRLDTIIIDEAQDVSAVQHAAFAPLIDAETRVILLADLKQTIYLWRNAQPGLLRQAIDEGEYFGIDWSTAVVEHETQTRRSRPDVAAAIDTVFDDVFTDSERGADGTIVDEYACLDPVRGATEGACVHLPTVTADTDPVHPNYIDPERGVGEAEAVAKTLSQGLAGGTFEEGSDESGQEGGEDGDGPTVTLLMHRRKHVDTYTEQLEAAGLTVGNATARLFNYPLVRLAVELCAVFAARNPTQALKDISHNYSEAAVVPETRDEPVLATTKLADVLGLWGPDIETVVDGTDGDRPISSLVHTFEELRQRHAYLTSQAPADAIETIIEAFDLRTDPLGISNDPMRDTMALDTLLAAVESGSLSAEEATFEDVVGQLKRLYAQPRSGPDIPLHDESRYDVVIKTVFQMKGDEADVIALGDLGQHVGENGPHTDTICTQGSAVALAPPVSEAAADTPAVPGYQHGVFDATRSPWDYDAGYRWVAQHWATETQLAGAPSLREMARIHRAGRWRLLYVAMTRARDHLVIPLPQTREVSEPCDYWIDTLREAFEFDETVITDDGPTDTYTCQSPSGRGFDVRVYTHSPDGRGDVGGIEADNSTTEAAVEGDTPDAPTVDARSGNEFTPAAATPAVEAPNGLVPRFINPSTFYHLLEDPDAHLIRYLQRRQLTPPDNAVDASLGLVFDSFGPADVGDIVHTVIERIISHREQFTTSALRECAEPVPSIIKTTLARSPDLVPAERRALVGFIADCVCPQLAESRLWQRVQRADAVYLEAPADTVTRVDDVAVEMQSLADIVTREGDQWAVTELKITLQDTPPTDAHRLQAQVYAWALTQQPDTGTVAAHVQHLGATAANVPVDWDPQTVRDRLAETRALF